MKIKNSEKLSFGTDGIRSNADQFPFTDQALWCLGRSIAHWAVQKKSGQSIKILIGMDTRISGDRVKKFLTMGLMTQGIQLIDAGITTTPAVCQIITCDKSYDMGIVISASHNPYNDNGIKVFDARRGKLTQEDEKSITDLFNDLYIDDHMLESTVPVVEKLVDVIGTYNQNISAHFKAGFLKKCKVVLDCANGAAYKLAPEVMRLFGAEVLIINSSPSGVNINHNCGALHPDGLSGAVKKHCADAGFAFDGDGDRVIAVNRYGQIKDGDDILLMLLALPEYRDVNTVIGTIMSNKGLDVILQGLGKELLRTPVGDKYVVAKLEEKNLPLGGEASGHTVMRDYLATGDGLFVALKVLESMIINNNYDMVTFEKFPQILLNVPVFNKKNLKALPFAYIIDQHEKMLHNGRMIVRYSGTENVLRIMTEAESYDNALSVAHDLAEKLQAALL